MFILEYICYTFVTTLTDEGITTDNENVDEFDDDDGDDDDCESDPDIRKRPVSKRSKFSDDQKSKGGVMATLVQYPYETKVNGRDVKARTICIRVKKLEHEFVAWLKDNALVLSVCRLHRSRRFPPSTSSFEKCLRLFRLRRSEVLELQNTTGPLTIIRTTNPCLKSAQDSEESWSCRLRRRQKRKVMQLSSVAQFFM